MSASGGAPLGGGNAGMRGSGAPASPEGAMPHRVTSAEDLRADAARMQELANRSEQMRREEAVQAAQGAAAAKILETPPTDSLADLEGRLEGKGPLGNIPAASAPQPKEGVIDRATGGFNPTAFSPEAATGANSTTGVVPEKSAESTEPASDDTEVAQQEEPAPAVKPATADKLTDQAPTVPENPPPQEPPKTTATSKEPVVPNLPPPDANAANPVDVEDARIAKERSDYMNGLVNGDSELKTMLEKAGILADPTKGFDVDKLVDDLQNKGDDRNLAEDRALRRLREVQGLTALHEGQQQMDALLKSGKDVTQGEGEKEFDDAKAKIERGRMSEMQKTLREKIKADEELKSWLRQTYPEKELEDIDGPQLIKTLRERQPGYYHNNADLMRREQKILDRLGAYAGEKKREYGLEDGMRARNDEERRVAIEQVAEGEKSQPSAFRKFKEKILRGVSGLSHEELQYLGRQAKGYKKTLKAYEERLRVAEEKGDASGVDGLRESIKNLKELSSSANREWRTKKIISYLLIFLILNTLAFTVGPALLTAKGFQLMGKAQQ